MITVTKIGGRLEISFERLSTKQMEMMQSIPERYVVNKNLWSIPDTEKNQQVLKEILIDEEISIRIPDSTSAKAFWDDMNNYEAILKLRGYSPKTRKVYKNCINAFYHFSKRSQSNIR